MGGSVLASWDCQGHVGRMSLIKRVVLEINNDLAYIIGKTLFPDQSQFKTVHRCQCCQEHPSVTWLFKPYTTVEMPTGEITRR